ncbi:MAG: segregation/condensation protein A, partial [Candidatus Aenigmatarchaeota archaeon]
MNFAPKIKLEIFEGPLDLLLHLIKKNEIDIRDIPVAIITKQYMEYLELMRFLNLEIAGEFLVMASTLLYLKSLMLIPREGDESDEEVEDPRKELVERLLEYKKCKELAEKLEQRSLKNRDVFVRESFDLNIKNESLVDISLFDLIDAFKRVIERSRVSEIFEYVDDDIKIKDVMLSIVEKLKNGGRQFDDLFDVNCTKQYIIATF